MQTKHKLYQFWKGYEDAQRLNDSEKRKYCTHTLSVTLGKRLANADIVDFVKNVSLKTQP